MLKKIIAAVLSTAVSSFVLSIKMYTPLSERHPNTGYESFCSWLPLFLVILGLAYILGGIPCSLLIDRFVKKTSMRFISYLIAGFIVGIITTLIFISFLSGPFLDFTTVLVFGLYGSLGAMVFYFLLVLLNLLKRGKY